MRDAETVSVRLVTDQPARIETPAQSAPRLAIHLGRSVYMLSQRGGQKHRGLAVHGDIEIVPAETPCVWEPSETGTWLVVSIEPSVLRNAAEELNLNVNRLELLNRCQIRDPQIEHICWALKAEMEAGYPNGRVFLNSLSTALAAALVCGHSWLAAPPFASSTKKFSSRTERR